MRRLLRRLAAALGYDLVPRRKSRDPMRRLVLVLERFAVDLVVDVGANEGQYAAALREAGWRGPILSIEPISEVRDRLARRAAADPLWTVTPAFAAGAEAGRHTLEISAESDMSSLHRQSPLLQTLSPSSAVIECREVEVRRLDRLAELEEARYRRLFVKLDIQGAEAEALDGMEGLWPRLAGLQLEMALLPLYEAETDWRTMTDRLAARGYAPYLWLPGYFEPKLARQVQVDGVFFKDVAEGGA